MPVAAARLADVLVGDANPVVPLRVGQHLLEELAVSLLDVGVVAEDAAPSARRERSASRTCSSSPMPSSRGPPAGATS